MREVQLKKTSLISSRNWSLHQIYGWIRLCSHCCREYHFIFIVHWT